MLPNSPFARPVGSFRTPQQPPDSEPDSGPLSTVSINCDWLPFVRGALTQLLLQSTWEVDVVPLETTQERAWRLINMFAELDCNMCDCIQVNGSTISIFVSDGHGGGSFVPVDPRTQGKVPAKWASPPSGESGNCLAAVNLAAWFTDMMGHATTVLGTEAEIVTIAVAFIDFLDLALGPFGLLLDAAGAMGAAAIDAGVTEMGLAFDPATQTAAYDGIRCLFQCHAAPDGSFSASAVADIKAEFYASIDGWVSDTAQNLLWRVFFPDALDSQGPNGLTGLAAVAALSTAACSDCPDCGWCHQFDLTEVGMGGWVIIDSGGSVYGTFEENTGVKSVIVSGLRCVRIYHPDLVGVSLSSIDVDYASTITTESQHQFDLAYDTTEFTPTMGGTVGGVVTGAVSNGRLDYVHAATDGDFWVSGVRVHGTGTNPFSDNCP